MRQDEKQKLQRQTKRKHWLQRFKMGALAVYASKVKTAAVAVYIISALLLFLFQDVIIYRFLENGLFAPLYKGILQLLIPAYAFCGLFFLIVAFGSPFGGKSMSDSLWKVGLCNHAGESPLLLSKQKDKDNSRMIILEFESNGISRIEWEDKQAKIEAALNLHVVKIEEGRDKRHILVHTISARSSLPQKLIWKDSYLNKDSFVLVLGETLIGQETVNLAKVPHVLLGGSTGSGKSILLKLLIMQCIKKDSVVYIADFKGGVDFPAVWHEMCNIVTDEKDLLKILNAFVDELEQRKEEFRKYGVANIDEYNRGLGLDLPRVILACDEVAEVLDKTGLSKENKETVSKIEAKLSIIARQGRAFGIHLILATQRPDATILSGQIRNNIDYRVCGRADNVLSQIILDNTGASEQIPKDAQGRFLTNNGTVFQGYLFDEQKAFEVG